MANRCFPSRPDATSTSGEWTSVIRNFRIYTDIAGNVAKGYGGNPTKQNGATYNRFGVHAGCLKSAPSQSELLAVTKGKHYANPVLSGAAQSSTSSVAGNAIVMDFSANGVIAVRDCSFDALGTVVYDACAGRIPVYSGVQNPGNYYPESAYPGFISDPSNKMFWRSSNCPPRRGTPWNSFENVGDVSYQWTPYFWRAVAGHSLGGMSFPEPVKFELQATKPGRISEELLPRPDPSGAYDPSASRSAWCHGRYAYS